MSIVMQKVTKFQEGDAHDRSSKHPSPVRAYSFAMCYLREIRSCQPVQIRGQSCLQSLPVQSLRYSDIFREMPVQRIPWKTFADAWPMRTVLCGHPSAGACRSGRWRCCAGIRVIALFRWAMDTRPNRHSPNQSTYSL